jgi:hypothetical protein
MDSEALPQQPSTQRKQHDPSGQSRAIARPNLTPSRRKSGPDPLSASAIRRQEASYNKMLYLLTQDARQHQQRINALREGYAQLMEEVASLSKQVQSLQLTTSAPQTLEASAPPPPTEVSPAASSPPASLLGYGKG